MTQEEKLFIRAIKEVVQKQLDTFMEDIEYSLEENYKKIKRMNRVMLEQLKTKPQTVVVEQQHYSKSPPVVENVAPVYTTSNVKREYSKNPLLNSILSSTAPLSDSDQKEDSVGEILTAEHMINQNKVIGADNQVFELNETTAKVLDITKRDFSKYIKPVRDLSVKV